MAISSKPKSKQTPSDISVDALINKGGSVANDDKELPTKKEQQILIRVPSDALEQIDRLVANRRIKTARVTWLLEAIFEKLDREEKRLQAK
jgi:molecular chaperone DnaK (HSP70)